MTESQVLSSSGSPVGMMNGAGEVTIRWNAQGWSLDAPSAADGSPRKYMPCAICGTVVAVPVNHVYGLCDCCDTDICADCHSPRTRGDPADRCACIPEAD